MDPLTSLRSHKIECHTHPICKLSPCKVAVWILDIWEHIRSPSDIALLFHATLCTVMFGHCGHTDVEIGAMVYMSQSQASCVRTYLVSKGVLVEVCCHPPRGRPIKGAKIALDLGEVER